MDIYPKCILDKVKNKRDIRQGQTDDELKEHFTKLLSYENLWKRIKLVIFSLEASLSSGREEKYREARELFQGMIQKRYGNKEFLNVPFFGMGTHRFNDVSYWGAWDAQMGILSQGIKTTYPQYQRLVMDIVEDCLSKTGPVIK